MNGHAGGDHDVETDDEDSRFQLKISLSADDEGFVGRECPNPQCEGYFKVTIGTGILDTSESHCPYCGHYGPANQFFTKEQVAYIQSIILHKVAGQMLSELKKHEFNYPARGPFGIGISMKVEGTPHPIHYYREKRLETVVICDQCTLRYAIYGVFAYCPDCGTHNSRQILDKNLELAEKDAALAEAHSGDLAVKLVEDALENEVSSFDGFGRATCRAFSAKATTAEKVENLSFQSLQSARARVQKYFGVDLMVGVTPEEWEFACRCFQKRHLLAHTMGVVDEEYMRLANDPHAMVGRKISITAQEVTRLSQVLQRLASYLIQQLI